MVLYASWCVLDQTASVSCSRLNSSRHNSDDTGASEHIHSVEEPTTPLIASALPPADAHYLLRRRRQQFVSQVLDRLFAGTEQEQVVHGTRHLFEH